jgi:hypothetical protein
MEGERNGGGFRRNNLTTNIIMEKKLEPCSLAMKCTGNFDHFDFVVKCFDGNNRFFGFDVYDSENKTVIWNFTNRVEMLEFIEPVKKEIATVLSLLKSEKMTLPDIAFGIYNSGSKSILLI